MIFSIISCSLSPKSRSRSIARLAEKILSERGHDVSFIDLMEVPLPPFDNDRIFADPNFASVHKAIDASDGVVIASPVYNWGLSAVAKNLIESTGSTGENGRRAAWFDKVVSFICTAGLPHSYMAYGSLALSLMLDFKCVINPYAVYASNRDFGEDGELCEALTARLEKALTVKIALSEALQHRTYRSDWEI